jgi:hypothetical protein
MRMTLNAILLACLWGLAYTAAAQPVVTPETEINHLLEFVAASSCTFIRNADRYDGPKASDHLRTKYEHDKRHVTSAEKFIDRVGSTSSMTGNPYIVNCAGKAIPTDLWLHQELATYRNHSDPLRKP